MMLQKIERLLYVFLVLFGHAAFLEPYLVLSFHGKAGGVAKMKKIIADTGIEFDADTWFFEHLKANDYFDEQAWLPLEAVNTIQQQLMGHSQAGKKITEKGLKNWLKKHPNIWGLHQEETISRLERLKGIVEEKRAQYGIEYQNIYLIGYSLGGLVVDYLSQTLPVGGIICINSFSNPSRESLGIEETFFSPQKALFLANKKDNVIPHQLSSITRQIFKKNNPNTTISNTDIDDSLTKHNISYQYNQFIRDFFIDIPHPR